jgi:hypothetical protein
MVSSWRKQAIGSFFAKKLSPPKTQTPYSGTQIVTVKIYSTQICTHVRPGIFTLATLADQEPQEDPEPGQFRKARRRAGSNHSSLTVK